MKQYLEGRYRVDLLERTTSEVPGALADAGAPADAGVLARALLESGDRVKFARVAAGPVGLPRGGRGGLPARRPDQARRESPARPRGGGVMTRLGRRPWVLLLLPLAAGVVWLLVRRLRTGGPRIALPDAAGVAELPTSPWARFERMLPWLRGGAIALTIVALARPQTGSSIATVSSNGVDIVIALDVSGSMRCEDTRPKNRLVVAKECIARFVEGRPDDRIGIVTFGSFATTRCPLTLDHDMLLRFVEEMDFAPPGEDRTALGMGLATAVNRMRASKAKSKVVVLVTDGKSNAGQLGPESAAEAARALGFKVYTIGVGSEGEVPCLVEDPAGQAGATSRCRPTSTRRSCRRSPSPPAHVTSAPPTTSDSQQAFTEIDGLEKTEMESRVRVLYTEKFVQALLPAGLLLGLELLLAGTRLRRIP